MLKALIIYAAAVLFAAGPVLPSAPSAGDAASLTAKLCGGGTSVIDLGLPKEEQQDTPCELEACHAGTCRKRVDLRQ